MNPRLAGLLMVLAQLAPGFAGEPSPRLLGIPGPAATVALAPELTTLEAVSDDGRRLLLTSASDRLVAGDRNAAFDVFLYDTEARRFTLVSTTSTGRSGNGTSLAGSMSADGTRVAYQTRASDLFPGDTNQAWDVVLFDAAAGTNALVSVATNGSSGRGASSSPSISADGRLVAFQSTARNIAPSTEPLVQGLFRRDLQSGQTILISTNLTGVGIYPPRIGEHGMSAGAKFVAFTALGRTNGVFLRDVEGFRTVRVSATYPSGFLATGPFAYANPVTSDDGGWVACRVTYGRTNAFFHYGLFLHTARALGTTTNAPPTNLDPTLLGPAMSTDGRFVAFAQSTPVPAGSGAVLQVFRWDATAQSTIPVSAAFGGGGLGNSHAYAPRLSPDGRLVVFLSDSTNLVAEATAPVLRAYQWDAGTQTLRVVAELGGDPDAASLVMSRNGAWIAALAQPPDGATRLHLFETATGQSFSSSLEPAAVDSLSARGGLAVQPSGASDDGRYVGLVHFQPGPAGESGPGQVLLLDTQTGTRSLVTAGLDRLPANANCTTPSLSADGTLIAYASDASNLFAGDANGFRDAFVSRTGDTPHRLIRPANLPATVRHAGPDVVVSPDGSLLWFTLEESGKFLPRLADLTSGAISPALPGVLFGSAVFSQDGRRIAAALTTLPSVSNPAVKIVDGPAWIAGGGGSAILWSAPLKTLEPSLSRDGSRVAFWLSAPGQNEIRVVDWAQNQSIFVHNLGSATPSSLSLSGDGFILVWIAPGPAESPSPQAWQARLADQTVSLVSVAADLQRGGNGATRHAVINASGRYAAFASLADDLTADDTNGTADVFLRDLQTSQTLLVSRTRVGTAGAGWSTRPFFSPNGQSLFFLSHAPDLAEPDLNQSVDLFKIEILGTELSLLVVLQRNLTTGQAQLLWDGLAGRQYQVEFKDDLGPQPWQSLPGTFTNRAPVELNNPAAPRRFYRVVEVR